MISRGALTCKLHQIDIFAPDKPKSQSKKEETSFVRSIRILEDTFRSFNIDVKVESEPSGPSVTKVIRGQACCWGSYRISKSSGWLGFLAPASDNVRSEAPIPGKIFSWESRGANSEFTTVSPVNFGNSQDGSNKLLEVSLGRRLIAARLIALIWDGCLAQWLGQRVLLNQLISLGNHL